MIGHRRPTPWPLCHRVLIPAEGNLLSMLEAVESLLAQGFRPRQTVYIAFGHDEEAGGERGAAHRRAAGLALGAAGLRDGRGHADHRRRDEFSTRGGQAWGVSVGEDGGKVVVSYYPNEACVASVTFAFRDRRWLLTRMSDACD